MSLQKSLSDIENDIQLARRYYNGTVRNYMSTKMIISNKYYCIIW